MKAIFFENNRVSLREFPKPVPSKGEALIKIILAGICNTDLEILKGYMNFSGIPGHEFVGIVEESVDKYLIGKRVIGEINAGCGVCGRCRNGDPRHCAGRTVLGILNHDGAFAEYLTLPVENLIEVPDNISDETAVLVEPLAAATQIADQVKIKKSNPVLIVGDGKLGLLIAAAMESAGASVTLLGHHKERNMIMLPSITNISNTEEALTNGKYPIIIEASGRPAGFNTAMNLLEPEGTLVLKSTFASSSGINAAEIVVNEFRIIGSRCGRFKPAIEALSTGRIRIPRGYIEDIFALENFKQAIECAQKKGALKVLLKP